MSQQPAPAKPKAKPALTPRQFVLAVLKLRETMAPKEAKLLERVPEAQRAEAQAMLKGIG